MAALRQSQSQFQEAIAYYGWLLRLAPADFNTQTNLSKLEQHRTRYPQPFPMSTVIAEIKQSVSAANQGLLTEALGRLESAIAMDPNSSLAHRLAAFLLEKIGRYVEAGRHFEAALTIDDRDKEAWHGLD